VARKLQVVSAVNVPHPISWADEERDLTAWLGNELQQEAFDKLYSLGEKVYESNDDTIKQDYTYLQVSDHFYYMSTKFFSDGEVHSYFNPYSSPYDAFINYMNVLSDFEIRVNAAVRFGVDDQVARLSKIIKEKDEQLEKLEKRLASTSKKSSSATKATKTATSAKSSSAKKTATATKSTSTKKTTSAKTSTAPKKTASAKKSTAAKTTASSKRSQTGKKS
jgi:alpha-amylase